MVRGSSIKSGANDGAGKGSQLGKGKDQTEGPRSERTKKKLQRKAPAKNNFLNPSSKAHTAES